MALNRHEMNSEKFYIHPKMSIDEMVEDIKPQSFEDIEHAILTTVGIVIPEEQTKMLKLNEFNWLPINYGESLSLMGTTSDESIKKEISPVIKIFEEKKKKNIINLQIIDINQNNKQIVYQTFRKIGAQ